LAAPGTTIGMLLVGGFFAYHQFTNTGLFTAKFGQWEMLALYGPIVAAMIGPLVSALTGRRNPARPVKVLTNLFLAIGSLWLAIAFPFNFAHLADPLPAALRFVIAWITDDIGRAVLILQVIIGLVTMIVTTLQYLSVRRQPITA
jgi:hypothetical protein